ncbi:ATP synthase F1 subunit delta [candidate division KSB1 bacterium]|nr:ATP synthase F1 subunit delta [candidate division KSB1 bacterium]MCH7755500.1 ATP synthase F1 subunit delta [candidate division KSB1 bacterium]MCH8980392.1 ATP synthase F1 subunit delta [candidate division KSB1 bacterium]
MKNTVLARRYAKALFELAVERKILDTIQNEVRSFSQSLDDNLQFRLFFFAQDVSKKQKREKIEELMQDRVSNVFFNFVLVLLKKNREFIFPEIVKEFQSIVDKYHRKINALAITAQPLDEKSSSKLKSLLDKTFDADVRIRNDIDASILGGIVVNVEGHVFDGSLQSQLARLKDDLVSNSKNTS